MDKCKYKFKCAVFDLDGTLINTIDDLAEACNILLRQNGVEPNWSIDDYKRFVGNGARLLVKRAFDNKLSESELDEQYERFKPIYDKIKLDNAFAYDGIPEVIADLKANGVKLAVCTNKPDFAAKGMVSALFGDNTFDAVHGALDALPKKPDPTVPKAMLDELGLSPSETVWIGDSDVDIQSARNLGCTSVAVSWGFRSRESLVAAAPDYLLDSPKEILKIFK